MRILHIIRIKSRQKSSAEFAIDLFFSVNIWQGVITHPSDSLNHLTWTSTRQLASLKISNCIQDSAVRIGTTLFVRQETSQAGNADKRSMWNFHSVVFRIPTRIAHMRQTSRSSSEWNYRYYRSWRKREARPPRESTEGSALSYSWSLAEPGREMRRV